MTSTMRSGMIGRIITCLVKYCSRTLLGGTLLNKNIRVHVSCDSYLLCLSDKFISFQDCFIFAITHFAKGVLAMRRRPNL